MRYSVRHVTRFDYEAPVVESVMEARMQPRSDGLQRCLHFVLTTSPPARVMTYLDHEGNGVHFFNIPARHAQLTVTADTVVECTAPPALPESLDAEGWAELDAIGDSGEWWEYLAPSPFAHSTPLLERFALTVGLRRAGDPLAVLRRLMAQMYALFEYRPQTTRVDSPIDEALEARRGVCQDFAHIFIALARPLGLPARYVSGYLFRGEGSHDRSTDGATHAWVEVLLPPLGWIGFDPTNNLTAGERHIRVAVGRDYADVPPTRGVYKGATVVRSELAVAVQVGADVSPRGAAPVPFTPWMSRDVSTPMTVADATADQDQQQQQ